MGWARRGLPLLCSVAFVLPACAAKTSAETPGSKIVPCTVHCTKSKPPKDQSPSFTVNGTRGTPIPRTIRTMPPATAYQDDGSVGGMELAYLRPAPAKKLYVEIDYVAGEAPAQSAIDHLASILRRETGKDATVALGVKLPEAGTTYTLQDIADLSARYRVHRSGGDTATAWIVSLNGSLKGGQGVLGISYRASEIAVFPDQMRQATTALVDATAIERSVLVHEMGHLLGLVNIGYKSRYDHEDPQHPGHSKFQTSVMYWAIEDISITALLHGGPPDDYDQYDRADLKMLRTG